MVQGPSNSRTERRRQQNDSNEQTATATSTQERRTERRSEAARAARAWRRGAARVGAGGARWWCAVSGRGGRARGPGPRSFEALRWLARLEVAGVEPLGHGAGVRARARRIRTSRGWRARAWWCARLIRAAAWSRSPPRAGARSAPTAATCARARSHGSGLRHARAVSWVAALLTLREREWVSERELRGREDWQVPVVWAAHRGRHRPDLGRGDGRGRGWRSRSSSRTSRRGGWRRSSPATRRRSLGGRIAGGLIYVSDRADVLDAVRARRGARRGAGAALSDAVAGRRPGRGPASDAARGRASASRRAAARRRNRRRASRSVAGRAGGTWRR